MAKLLITGASGFLGFNLCRFAADTWSVHGVVRSHRIAIPRGEIHAVDLTDYRDLKDLFRAVAPDAVIHSAAMSQPNDCEIYRAESRRINVDAALAIAGLSADREIPFAFISTDLIFDGRTSPYKEGDPPSPVSVYAEQKIMAEEGIRSRCPTAAICRMSLMFGDPGPAATSFIQPFLKSMRAGDALRLFVDEYRTPVNARTAAEGIFLSLEKVKGTIHLGGSERISRYEFGLKLAEILEIKSAVIQPAHQADFPMAAARPPDVSLDSARANALGYKPGPLSDQIAELKGVV